MPSTNNTLYYRLQAAPLLLILALLPTVLQAQTNDVGLWLSTDFSHKLSNSLSLDMEGEYRMRDHISASERYAAGVSLSYKNKNFLPWLKGDIGYTYMYKCNPGETSIKYEADELGMPTTTPKHQNIDQSYWCSKHRASASLSGSFKVGRFKFSLRERYQFTYRAEATCDRTRLYYNPFYEIDPTIDAFYLDDDPESPDYSYMKATKKPKSDHKLRSRLSVSYNIKHCKFSPFADAEVYNNLAESMHLVKTRYTVGTDYSLNKHSSLTAYYRFIDHTTEDEAGGHVIGMSYSLEF